MTHRHRHRNIERDTHIDMQTYRHTQTPTRRHADM